MPVVKFFVRLDLEQIFLLLDGHYLIKGDETDIRAVVFQRTYILFYQPNMTKTNRQTDQQMGETPVITFAKHDKSDAYKDLLHPYDPPIKNRRHRVDQPRSRLTLACITEKNLYDALCIEAHTTALTPNTYKEYLANTTPDLLIVESAWVTSTGYWHLAQHPSSPERANLLDLVSKFKKKSIPTIYWITKGHEYHDHFNTFATFFDYVFCTDPIEATLLQSEGCRAEVLLPCVQPKLFNPFRFDDQAEDLDIGVLFDGWADIDRLGEGLKILEKVKPFGLDIIESRYDIPKKRLAQAPAWADRILGCVTHTGRRNLLKYARTYLTCTPSLADPISKQWETIEAAACRLPIVHFGALEKEDCRAGIAKAFLSSDELINEIDRLHNDALYREKSAHLGWRDVFKNHTIADRLHTICRRINTSYDWQAFPPVSIITPTYRAPMIERCIRTFNKQTYPNKEMIIVFNGDAALPEVMTNLIANNDHIQLITVPREMFTGACMNLGIHVTDNQHLLKMDDDDYYGDNYVLDMMLYNRAVDADVICKPNTSFYTFECEPGVYLRKEKRTTHTIKQLTRDSVFRNYLVAGNSISLMSRRARSLAFDDYSYGAADASFIYSCAASNFKLCTVDRLNMLISRRDDLSSHTWKEEKSTFKEKLECITDQPEDVMI